MTDEGRLYVSPNLRWKLSGKYLPLLRGIWSASSPTPNVPQKPTSKLLKLDRQIVPLCCFYVPTQAYMMQDISVNEQKWKACMLSMPRNDPSAQHAFHVIALELIGFRTVWFTGTVLCVSDGISERCESEFRVYRNKRLRSRARTNERRPLSPHMSLEWAGFKFPWRMRI